MIKINRTEYLYRVTRKLCLENNDMLMTIDSDEPFLDFVNDKVKRIFNETYKLQQKEIFIEKDNLIIDYKGKNCLNLFGIYDALLNSNKIELNISDEEFITVYRVEDCDYKGPYSYGFAHKVDNGPKGNKSPRQEFHLSALFATDHHIKNKYKFGFKDIKSLKKYFLTNPQLDLAVTAFDFYISAIKIKKNDVLFGENQIAYNTEKIIHHQIIDKFDNISNVKKIIKYKRRH